jgi:hypothetical protein
LTTVTNKGSTLSIPLHHSLQDNSEQQQQHQRQQVQRSRSRIVERSTSESQSSRGNNARTNSGSNKPSLATRHPRAASELQQYQQRRRCRVTAPAAATTTAICTSVDRHRRHTNSFRSTHPQRHKPLAHGAQPQQLPQAFRKRPPQASTAPRSAQPLRATSLATSHRVHQPPTRHTSTSSRAKANHRSASKQYPVATSARERKQRRAHHRHRLQQRPKIERPAKASRSGAAQQQQQPSNSSSAAVESSLQQHLPTANSTAAVEQHLLASCNCSVHSQQ